MPEPAINVPLHEDFPVPAKRFVLTLRKTEDEIWTRLLLLEHGTERLIPAEWRRRLTVLKMRKT